ncbi:hypothetical protein LguiA_008137 [Lonicera macranthoides]
MLFKVLLVTVGVEIRRRKPKTNLKVRFWFLNVPNLDPNQAFQFGFIQFSYFF